MTDGKDLNGIRIKRCSVNVYAVIYLCDNMWVFFSGTKSVQLFLSLPYRSSNQEGRIESPSTGLTPPHVCARPKLGPAFQMAYVVVSLVMQRRVYLFC